MVKNQTIKDASYEIMRRAAIDIPEDYLDGIKSCPAKETEQLSSFVIESMIENNEAATESCTPLIANRAQ